MKLIIDMPMPKRCGVCKCRRVEFDLDRVAVFCAIKDNKYVEDPDSRPSWCPIKGVLPDEHGDLIDRSELKNMKVFSQEFNRYVVPMMYIEEAKPIIAAERKDDEQIH